MDTLGRKRKVLVVEASKEGKKLGNTRALDAIVWELAAQHMDFACEDWLTVIEKVVPAKTVELNKEAFLVGYHM